MDTSASEVLELAAKMEILGTEMAAILKISIRTYRRLSAGGEVPEHAKEIVGVLKTIEFLGRLHFHPYESFVDWLHNPFELGPHKDKSPNHLLKSLEGLFFVRNLLLQLSQESTPQYAS